MDCFKSKFFLINLLLLDQTYNHNIENMASFGQFIKKEREMRKWTQTQFGAKIGINSSAISRIENGTQKFSSSKLEALSKLFKLNLQDIKDHFFADKFAREAFNNQCSDSVFSVAEDTIKYLKINQY